MTREECKKIIAVVAATYPTFDADDPSSTVDAWFYFLEDYDYGEIGLALKMYVISSNSPFAPSVSQLIGEIKRIKTIPGKMNGEEAWDLAYKAMGNSIYNSVEEFNKLPPLVQKAVGSPGNLRELAMADEEFVLCEKGRFLRVFEAEQKRSEELDSMPESVKQLILSNQPKGIEG